MDKPIADKYLYEYKDRIFGFALGKTGDMDEAQEKRNADRKIMSMQDNFLPVLYEPEEDETEWITPILTRWTTPKIPNTGRIW